MCFWTKNAHVKCWWNCHLQSISSMLYAHIFRMKFWRQNCKAETLALMIFGERIFARNARIKCWWNFYLISTNQTFQCNCQTSISTVVRPHSTSNIFDICTHKNLHSIFINKICYIIYFKAYKIFFAGFYILSRFFKTLSNLNPTDQKIKYIRKLIR